MFEELKDRIYNHKLWILYLEIEALMKGKPTYLFEKPFTWKKFWCRLRGHPDGPIFYNPLGTEPNWTCKNCGDDLG